MKIIATALVKAQSEMSNPVKGSNNPFFKSKYADLNSVREAVLPVLNANGISVLQPMRHIDGKNFINTIFLHESGEMIESFTEIVYAKTNDAQAQGSGITYARRYGLQSLACVGADDDDGHAASQQPQAQKTGLPPIQVVAMPNPKVDPELLNKAVSEMMDAPDRPTMEGVWKKYNLMQKEPRFVNAATEAGKKYPKA
jgi:hypothetical protein